MNVDRHGLEVLGREECLQLLGQATVGRIALCVRAMPMILPVAFHFDGQHILIGATPGTTLATATPGAVVAFEADSLAHPSDQGWSVTITGQADRSDDATHELLLRQTPATQWLPAADITILAIQPEVVSGRRLHQRNPSLAS